MTNKYTLATLSDDALLDRLAKVVRTSRRVEADLSAHIAEVDARRLYAREASSSMHVYCVGVLHLSDGEAYLRIAVARATRKHPLLLDMLADGRLHLSGIERQFTVNAKLREKLARLQALMRSSVPDGDLAAIIDLAVTEKLDRLEAKRFGKTKAPRKTVEGTDTSASSRYIPAAVRRVVHERDGGRCRYVDARGKRCGAHHRLEFHHDGQPYARGGDHRPSNIKLMCRTHNALLAERDFGKEWMGRFRSKETGTWDSPARPGAK